jgi:Glycine zipper
MSTTRTLYQMVAGLGFIFLSTGCATDTGTGALAGGVGGAGIGALAGAATGHAGAGAAIGGLAGALVGGAVGNESDRQKQAAAAARPVGPAMGVTEVIEMTKQGVREDLIINQIQTTNSYFNLSTGDISLLQTNGVSPNVILVMQNRRPRYVRPAPTYVYGPYYNPPPPVAIRVYP